jgi:hypothetical protein
MVQLAEEDEVLPGAEDLVERRVLADEADASLDRGGA